MKVALLAGSHSGCGKTTAMLALLQYLQQRGLEPRSFKVGPDFIDPLWHTAVTHKPCYNLDTEMIGAAESQALLEKVAGLDGLALIEGVMGMFDGKTGIGQAGSSVDLARRLAVPVLLVIDAHGMAGSIAPMVAGYYEYANRMNVQVRGVIANRVGGDYHAGLLRQALLESGLPPLVAWIGSQPQSLAERHLGLTLPEDGHELANFQQSISVDEAALLGCFAAVKSTPDQVATSRLLAGKTIAIAKDAACCFIYPANLDWLTEQGAKLSFFSPLAGDPVPSADGLWLPGGYPELHGQSLANSASLTSIKAFIESGKPVLAECGGTMLLGESLVDPSGNAWRMAGVLPFVSRMGPGIAALGYRQEASGMRGHEFHFSIRESESELSPAFVVNEGDAGVRYRNLRASYVHWYFKSAPTVAAQWLINEE